MWFLTSQVVPSNGDTNLCSSPTLTFLMQIVMCQKQLLASRRSYAHMILTLLKYYSWPPPVLPLPSYQLSFKEHIFPCVFKYHSLQISIFCLGIFPYTSNLRHLKFNVSSWISCIQYENVCPTVCPCFQLCTILLDLKPLVAYLYLFNLCTL